MEHVTAATTLLMGWLASASALRGATLPPLAAASQPLATAAGAILDLVDVDANLLHDDLVGDLDNHIDVAKSVGVRHFVVPGSTLDDSRAAIKLAMDRTGVVYPTAGVHPYHSYQCSRSDLSAAIAELRTMVRENNSLVTCIGECGLDASEGFPPLEAQVPWFEAQVELACELRKPLFLHERKAFQRFVNVLDRHGSASKQGLPPCLVHCFTGGAQELSHYLSRDFYIGVTGFIKKETHGAELRSIIGALPLDRVMIETDAPYLGFKGCRKRCKTKPKQQYPNVPSALPEVLDAVAEAMGVTRWELAAAATQNARAFFGMNE
ncbi:unnamed protein product [Chrysoparadoxa australica]